MHLGWGLLEHQHLSKQDFKLIPSVKTHYSLMVWFSPTSPVVTLLASLGAAYGSYYTFKVPSTSQMFCKFARGGMQLDTSVFVFTLDGVETAEDVFNSSFNCEIFSPSSFKVFIIFALSSGFIFLFFSSLEISIYKIIRKNKSKLSKFKPYSPTTTTL